MEKTMNYSDKLDEIKSRYDCKIRLDLSSEYQFDDLMNYTYFKNTMKKLELDSKLQKLRQKLEDYKGDKFDDIEIEKKKKNIDEMITELNNIKKESKAKNDYSQNLLNELENDYAKNRENKEARTIFKNVARDIVESTYKFYIKCEKRLIILVDNINSFKL